MEISYGGTLIKETMDWFLECIPDFIYIILTLKLPPTVLW